MLLFLLAASVGQRAARRAAPGAAAVDRQARRRAQRRRAAIARRTRRPPPSPGTGRRRDRARGDAARRAPACSSAASCASRRRTAASIPATCCCCRSTFRGTYDNAGQKSPRSYTEATRRIRALPGVVAVGAISDFFIHRQPDYRVALEGQPPRRAEDPAPPLTEDQVIPGYLRGDADSVAPRPAAAGQRPRPGRAAGHRHQRGNGPTFLAGPGSRRQALEVRARSRRRRIRGRPSSAWSPTCDGSGWTSRQFPTCSSRASRVRWISRSGRSAIPTRCARPIRAEMRAIDPDRAAVRHRHGRAAAGTNGRAAPAADDAPRRAGGGRAGPRGDRRIRRDPSVGRSADAGDRRCGWRSAQTRPRCCGWCSAAGLAPAAAGLGARLARIAAVEPHASRRSSTKRTRSTRSSTRL